MRPFILLSFLCLLLACTRYTSRDYLHVDAGKTAHQSRDTLVLTRLNKKWQKPAFQEYRLDKKKLFRLNYAYSDSGSYVVRKQHLQGSKWTDPHIYKYAKDGKLRGHAYLNRFSSDTLSYDYYPDGSISRSFYLNTNGVHGRELHYYPNGGLRAVRTFYYGRLISVDSLLHPDGSLLPIGDFKDGNGSFKIYDCDGKEIGTRTYENGRLPKKKK